MFSDSHYPELERRCKLEGCKKFLRDALLQSLSPRDIHRKTHPDAFSLTVFKKAVILVYRENNKLKKRMVSIVCDAAVSSHKPQVGSLV